MKTLLALTAAAFLAGCSLLPQTGGSLFREPDKDTYIGPPGSAYTYELDWVPQQPVSPEVLGQLTEDQFKEMFPNAAVRLVVPLTPGE